MKKWLSKIILKVVFKGVSEKDLVDLNLLTDLQYENYCFAAVELTDNIVFQAELKRLRQRQENYIAYKAKNSEDLIYGRAALYIIDLLEKRVQYLALESEKIKQEYKENDAG